MKKQKVIIPKFIEAVALFPPRGDTKSYLAIDMNSKDQHREYYDSYEEAKEVYNRILSKINFVKLM